MTARKRSGYNPPVSAERVIAAPVEKLWDVISMPGNLEPCHPFCTRNPVLKWPGPGSIDEVHYLSGWVFHRHFTAWHEGEGYELEISRPGGQKSFVRWSISARDDEHACLRITVYPRHLRCWPAALQWIPYYFRIRPMLQAYLSSVVRGFEWFVTREEAVPRNQFGQHPWFS